MNIKLQPLYILYPRNDNKGSIFITFNKFRKTFINNTEKRTPALQMPIFSTIFYISIHKITHAKKERRHKPAFSFLKYMKYIWRKKYMCKFHLFVFLLSCLYNTPPMLQFYDNVLKTNTQKISAKKRLPYDRRFLLV